MRKLNPAQKLDLVLAYPRIVRPGKNSFFVADSGAKPRRLHAMYSALYPREFLAITPAPNWTHYDISYHEIGSAPGYLESQCEVGIVCPVQFKRFDWAPEAAAFAAELVTNNRTRLAALSPCRIVPAPDRSAWCYIPAAWTLAFKESVNEVYSWHNAWLAQLYTEHAATLEKNPKCTSLQVQQQLDKAAAVGGLRPALAAKWDAKVLAFQTRPWTLNDGTTVPFETFTYADK